MKCNAKPPCSVDFDVLPISNLDRISSVVLDGGNSTTFGRLA